MRRPRLRAVERHAGAAVVALDHPAGVRRIDPEIVVVAVRRRHLDERLAAVDRLPERVVRHPHGVDVGRIGEDVHVVPGTAAQPGLLARALPGGAAVVGAEERAVLGLDHRVDAPAVGGGDGDADPSEHAARQSGVPRDVGPRVAAVGRLPERRVRPAARHAPRGALRLPHRGEQHARVLRVDRQIDRARPLALEQHVLPRGAAVARAEDAALAVRAPRVAERRHVDEIGIARMHAHAADVARVAEAPRWSTCGRRRWSDRRRRRATRCRGCTPRRCPRRPRSAPRARRRARRPRRSRRSRRRRSPSRCRRPSSSRRRPRTRRSRTSCGSVGWPATATTRPPRCGPTQRHWSESSSRGSIVTRRDPAGSPGTGPSSARTRWRGRPGTRARSCGTCRRARR